jgi:hypothetical protein
MYAVPWSPPRRRLLAFKTTAHAGRPMLVRSGWNLVVFKLVFSRRELEKRASQHDKHAWNMQRPFPPKRKGL